MAPTPFKVEVLTPEGLVWEGDAERLSTRTETGSIGILARHQPLLALLAPTELRVLIPGGETVRFAQGEGYVQVSPERVLVLVEEAIAPSELDAAKLQAQIDDAAKRVEAEPDGSERKARAQRDERRARAFLGVISAD